MVSGVRKSTSIRYSLNRENPGRARSADVKESSMSVRLKKTWDCVLAGFLVWLVTLGDFTFLNLCLAIPKTGLKIATFLIGIFVRIK